MFLLSDFGAILHKLFATFLNAANNKQTKNETQIKCTINGKKEALECDALFKNIHSFFALGGASEFQMVQNWRG